MRIQRHITQFIAAGLTVLLSGATVPVSAAEISAPANMGSVTAVGSVQLRGVGVHEGTVFSGDSLSVAPGAYAKVVFGVGPKVELDGNSNVTVSKDADAINIQMTSGNIAFTGNGQKPVHVRVGAYEITASGQSRGSVAFVGSSAFGVRAMAGSIMVRNTTTKQSYTVQKGNERLISLSDSNPAGVQLASSAPTSIPAAPSMPTPAKNNSKKTALLAAALIGSGAAIVILLTKNDDASADATLRLKKAQLAQNLSNATTTAQSAAGTASQISTSATNVNNAIAGSTVSATVKANLTTQATAIITKANTSAQTVSQLQAQLVSLQGQLDSASGPQATAIQGQITTLLGSLNGAVSDLNADIDALNALIQQASAAGVANIPNTTIGKVDQTGGVSPFAP